MQKPYKPIDCSFYDRLESMAIRKSFAVIKHLQADQSVVETEGIVSNVGSEHKIEYLYLFDGRAIRLDWILSINNQTPDLQCGR